jgi:hypothetical protein
MSQRSDLYLDDILEAIRRVERAATSSATGKTSGSGSSPARR